MSKGNKTQAAESKGRGIKPVTGSTSATRVGSGGNSTKSAKKGK